MAHPQSIWHHAQLGDFVVGRIFRIGLIGTWLALVAILVQQRLDTSSPESTPAEAAAPAPEGEWDGWMGVYLKGQKVGYSHSRITPDDGGFQLEDRSVLRMRVLDSDQTIYAASTARTDASYALQTFTVSLRSDAGNLEVEGVVNDAEVVLQMVSGGESSTQSFPIDGPLYLPSAARAQLREDAMHVGRRLSVAVFDASSMASHDMVIEVAGRDRLQVGDQDREVWKLRESFRGIESTVWMDDQGRTLREQGPMGMVTVREPADMATQRGWGEGPLVDLMNAVAIPVHPKLAAPRELAQLNVRLSGLGGLQPPLDGRQMLEDGILTVRREPSSSTFELPYSGSDLADDLAPTPFLQVDHPRVSGRAAEILGSERDANRAAVLLRRWVFEFLDKRAVVSIPNALQVLEMGAGDCNEHAVLLAALARAAGLPARVVAGIVYADGVFLYHAWDELWLGDGWVTVDAAFDQMPADATHIKLLEGGPDTHIGLVPAIGQLSIEVVSAPGARRG
jgi:hypothetical protein